MWNWYLLAGLLLICYDVNGLICNDIDTQACQLISNQRPDMCNDSSIADTTCPRFCNKCALECYHCDKAVVNVTDCNTTKACGPDEVCMLKELKSSADSHHEYVMTCESKQHCDGVGLTFPFGRRDIVERDVNVKCCESDLCNYPSSSLSMTTTTIPAMTTTNSGCLKDVMLVVDESVSLLHEQHDILHFLSSLVGDLDVSMQGTHVSFATFSSTAHEQFGFNKYYSTHDMQSAIRKVHFRGGAGTISSGLAYILTQATRPTSGNRAHVPDALLFITNSGSSSRFTSYYEQLVHQKIGNVIAVGIGSHTNSHELQQIASDSHHLLQVHHADDLDIHQSQLVRLICG